MEFTYSLAMIAFNNITFKHSNKTAFCIFIFHANGLAASQAAAYYARESAHD